MKIPLYQIDAFTEDPFKGNPAAVCPTENALEDELYQHIAAEMNLSETAFIHPAGKEGLQQSSVFHLRWFTPETEVPLCGHGTLSAAYVLFTEYKISGTITFLTKSGELRAGYEDGQVIMDFPVNRPEKIAVAETLKEPLNLTTNFTTYLNKEQGFLMLLLESEKDVVSLTPDFGKLRKVRFPFEIHGLIVTAASDHECDFSSRVFVPWEGIDEDPVTGSAHTVLGPFWSEKLNKKRLTAFQASKRGGVLELEVGRERMSIKGNAVKTIEGIIMSG